ncbi:MAG: phenylalanine--tRNA ligase subunit beta [Holosporaceae bacterium]|jgi:phenylalanyl-tRNA synthetase beta chain|nr:phenylalanine--tRNA ligase subunit beta [Holosporaceae bacterium]
MRFSFSWLKHYLATELSVQEIAEKLTAVGLEVEHIEDPLEKFKNFKLVQIKNAQKHPEADQLKVCVVVDMNGNENNIVCGAANAREGLKTVLAMPGAVIPKTGELLRKRKIRGIVSEGMMCSCEELAIPDKQIGIIEIHPSVELSASVAEALGCGDEIFDVSITPNRGDCFSLKGIARDLAATGAGKFIVADETPCKPSFPFSLNIKYKNSESIRGYAPLIAFRTIHGIKNGESPKWLTSFLKLAGMNSISSIVDLSNFWMMDSGRPTHIYDLNKIKGSFHIRFANVRETFTDIKGVEHKLLPDMLVAADDESPLCLMGVMGGKKTACNSETTDILIESALFNRIFISRAGALLNLTSDSRTRFERGIDLTSCVSGLEGLTRLILENCGGEASEVRLVGESPFDNERRVFLRKSKLQKIGGRSQDWDSVKNILQKLGLREYESNASGSLFCVPSWRADLNIEEDLVEEVLRIAGYEGIPAESIDMSALGRDKLLKRKRRIVEAKRLLASRGLSEVVTYSFTSQRYADAFENEKKNIHLMNPISVDLGVMRPSLLPALLQSATRLLSRGSASVGLFECGNIFYNSCEQKTNIAGVRLGMVSARSWAEKMRQADVFDVKGDVLAVLDHYDVDDRSLSTEPFAPCYYHPSRSGTIVSGKKKLGYFGELHPKICKLFDISGKIVCFEVMVDQLPSQKVKASFDGGKVFPKINRDFAFLFSAKTAIGNIIDAIYQLDPLIKKAIVFDYFDMNASQKSIGISVMLDAETRTLEEEEAQVVSQKIIQYVEGVGGELRKK